MMTFDQGEYDIRCEWGEQGVAGLAQTSDAVIIVDVMSFSTCVSVAASRGAIVFPYRWKDESRIAFAQSVGAELAGHRGKSRYSLSPTSLLQILPGERLVLPSPNGSNLTLSTGQTPTFAGCFRNSMAVAQAASRFGQRIAVIPAGERWKEDNSLRPASEDLVGAGAIISHLTGSLSPEARVAVDAFRGAASDLLTRLKECSSGKELIAMGYEDDIPLIAQMDVDDCAPVLKDGAYRKAEPKSPGCGSQARRAWPSTFVLREKVENEATLVEYYGRRAAEYEEIYRRPERQPDLMRLAAILATAFAGMDILEVACGTGYWTQCIARSARKIIASDINEEVLEIARRKAYGPCSVSFLKSDAYSLDGVPAGCTAGFHGFWWSHIPRQRIAAFLQGFHAHLPSGSRVVMIDNAYVEGSSTPIARRDEHGNTYQVRQLKDGSKHEVLKNFPPPAELRESLAGQAEDIEVRSFAYYWMASYKRK